jgi:hypothetical protein
MKTYLTYLTYLALLTTSAFAQGTAFTYQGQLNDGATPATGIYDLRFSIHDAPVGGKIAGVLTNAATTVSNGLFTATLDFGPRVFNGDDYWLNLGVRTNGSGDDFTPLTPRQPITTTPYAVFSSASGSVSNGLIQNPTFLGTTGSTPLDLKVGGRTALRLALGPDDGYIGYSLNFIGGTRHEISPLSRHSIIAAGDANRIEGGDFVTISGGTQHTVESNANWATISGGTTHNIAPNAHYAVVAGGEENRIGFAAEYSSIGGGLVNLVEARGGTIPGGLGNIVRGGYGFAAGLFAHAEHPGSFVWSDAGHLLGIPSGPFVSTTTNQFAVRARGGVRFETAGAGMTVDGQRVLSGTVTAAEIADGAITTAKLAAGSVTTVQLADGSVSSTALADGAITAAKVATVSNWFALTIANPTPESSDLFGGSVAAVGTDTVLIGAREDDSGAPNAGAAYLFSTQGTLLTTFRNPTSAMNDSFGHAVASVGSQHVLIGAYQYGSVEDIGAAYLFSTNGALVKTFINPLPNSSYFGLSVAALGNDRLLIGAHEAAHLYSTNGAWLMTFTNPTPHFDDGFGESLAALGNDRVLIGAWGEDTGGGNAGAAYLFSTNGTLLTTFIHPTPAFGENLGYPVAAMGNDRVLIGARGNDTGANAAGAAYLFSADGTLLATFTNPTPANLDFFGEAVAAVGEDRVLISTSGDDTGAEDAGAAYLFSTNGTLLATFINPTAASGGEFSDLFGLSLAGVGDGRVLVGAPGDDTGATDAGAVYLFSIETFTPGLVADVVNARSITTSSLEDGAVTLAKLDSNIGVWTRSGDNVFRLPGNVGIGTTTFTSNRLQVAGMIGATAFNTVSDRAAKQDFTPVDARAVLAKVAALPIAEWNFKEFPGARHLGPMAQDFHAAFGLGHDEKSIATVDADGVALAAIQGLNEKLEEKERRIEALERTLVELKQMVERLAPAR